jgi:Na+/H+-dicarboxylate symporter
MMVIILEALDLPFEAIALIFVIDWLLDRFRTSINVWGDCVGAAVIDNLSGTEPTL